MNNKNRNRKAAILLAIVFLIGFLAGVVSTICFSRNYTIVVEEPYKNETEKDAKKEDEQPAPKKPVEEKAPEKQAEKAPVENKENKENLPKEDKNDKKLIVIDAGHQKKGNSAQEPIAPGASQTKAKVASGTAGVSTDVPEYQVNLDVSLILEKELRARGYEVIMIRSTNEVDISNSERALMANKVKADAFIRIHCNGSENSAVNGALTMCQTSGNKYCGDLYKESRLLSDSIINALCKNTGAKNLGVSETDTMSGINWCRVPVTIVEMGFMSNPEEDKLLCDSAYQKKLAIGIANGVDDYFKHN